MKRSILILMIALLLCSCATKEPVVQEEAVPVVETASPVEESPSVEPAVEEQPESTEEKVEEPEAIPVPVDEEETTAEPVEAASEAETAAPAEQGSSQQVEAPVQTESVPSEEEATQEAPPPVEKMEEEKETVEETLPAESVEKEAAAMAEPPAPAVSVVLKCKASGTKEESNKEAVIDYSNSKDGYIMVKYKGDTNKRLKVRVVGPSTTYTYNLSKGQWTVFPLSDGNGTYTVTVYRNAGGDQYATVLSASLKASLKDQFAPFLRPNQYVDYSVAPNTVAKGAELCAGISDPLSKVAAIYDYVVDHLSYDYNRAATVKSGYLPVLDTVLSQKKGICFDYAAVMAAMLRSQQVPCKLVVGYAGGTYHAWISVWTAENGWIDGAIFFNGQSWKRMDPTYASSSGRSQEIMNFIENGSYTTKYLY